MYFFIFLELQESDGHQIHILLKHLICYSITKSQKDFLATQLFTPEERYLYSVLSRKILLTYHIQLF